MIGKELWAASGAAALALLLGSCATVVSGTSHDISVDTEPQGASCTFARGAEGNLGTVAQTPGKLNVSRRKDAITLTCTREGYEPVVETVESIFTGATVGNILVGGLIGAAVDAASGANNRYPDRIILPLVPASFPNAADRDAYFAQVADRIRETAARDSKKILDTCSASKREFCQIDVQRLEETRDRTLASLERRRAPAATVGSTPPPR